MLCHWIGLLSCQVKNLCMYIVMMKNTSALQSLTTSEYTTQLLQKFVMSNSLFTGNVLSKPMPRTISSVSLFCPPGVGLI